MNPLDWVLAALLTYSTVRAATNGLFQEAFAFAGFVIGFPLACWYYHDLARALSGMLTTAPLAQITAFFLILASVTLGASFLGKLFRRGARTIGLGFVDRFGGAAFGLLRGAGVGVALLLAVTAFLPTAPWVQTSQLAPYLLRSAHAVSFTMPPDLRVRLWDGIQHLNHSSTGWIKPGPLSHTRTKTLQF